MLDGRRCLTYLNLMLSLSFTRLPAVSKKYSKKKERIISIIFRLWNVPPSVFHITNLRLEVSAPPSQEAKLQNVAANVENQSLCTCLMGRSLSAAARITTGV